MCFFVCGGVIPTPSQVLWDFWIGWEIGRRILDGVCGPLQETEVGESWRGRGGEIGIRLVELDWKLVDDTFGILIFWWEVEAWKGLLTGWRDLCRG